MFFEISKMISKLYRSLGLLSILALAACGQPDAQTETAPNLKTVETISMTLAQGYTQTGKYTGRVEALLDSQLGFEIGGLLSEVSVDEGELVKKGAVLARLDTQRLQARRAEAKAALAQVRADLALAQATLARTEEALSYKGVSQQQLDEAKQRSNALTASEAVAKARLDSIDVDLKKARLTAPFDGVVVARLADPGQVLNSGSVLFQLQTADSPEVRIGVAPQAVASLQVGDTYSLQINRETVPAILKTIVPRRNDQTRTVDTLFEIPGSPASVRPGDLAVLTTDQWIEKSGFWLPISALTEGPRGLWQGLVAIPEAKNAHKLINRTVEILYADGQRAFVRGTLSEGDLLVSDGVHRVVAGQMVRIHASNPARLASVEETGR